MSRVLYLALAAAALFPMGAVTAQDYITAQDDERVAVAQEVYRDVVRASGTLRRAPSLVVRAGLNRDGRACGGERGFLVAYFCPGQERVVLEEHALAISFGLASDPRPALALLLAHELTHALHHERLMRGLAASAGMPEDCRAMELEADQYGNLYAYRAGYGDPAMAPGLWRAVYADPAYLAAGIGTGNCHPPLDDRLAILEEARAAVEALIPWFDLATALSRAGMASLSARVFDWLLRDFPSREIWNNLGVERLRAALASKESEDFAFRYPLQLDPDSRLADASFFAFSKDSASIARHLQEAGEAFRAALLLDPEYMPARLNLAAVADLEGDHQRAADLAREVIEEASDDRYPTVRAAAHQLLAIALAGSGDEAGARLEFDRAAELGGAGVAWNVAILDRNGGRAPGASAPVLADERVAGFGHAIQDIARMRERLDVRDVVIPGDVEFFEPNLRVDIRREEDWWGGLLRFGRRMVHLLVALPGYEGASQQGVRVGSTAAAVQATYGEPARVLAHPGGETWVYGSDRGIAFDLGGNGELTVEGWTLFSLTALP